VILLAGMALHAVTDRIAGSTRSRSSGNTLCVTYLESLIALVLLMKVCTRQRRAVQIRDGGVEVLWWLHPIASAPPSGSVRV
jgi:hypothetical protein